MVLSSGGGVIGERRLQEPMSREEAEHLVLRHRLPFTPTAQRPDGIWYFACTQLQRDGRCGIYDGRPQVCRDFREGSDPLCVHYWAEEPRV
jgi:Fe-S-cluster containining protein